MAKGDKKNEGENADAALASEVGSDTPTTDTAKVNNEQPKSPKVKKDDVVEIKREDLERLMAQLDKNQQDIDLLYKAADKNRLSKEMDRGDSNLIKQVRIAKWEDNGKYIIAWKLTSNRCEVVMGKWVEDQSVAIIFEDGESVTVPLLELYRKTINKIAADLLKRVEETDEKGNKVTMFNVQFPNGKKLTINSVFVN